MMRRKNTSRRVQTFSSVSIRSDEIAATDMALSCEWPCDAASDIGVGALDREGAFIGHSWPLGAAKSIRPFAVRCDISRFWPHLGRFLGEVLGRGACGRSRPRGRTPYKGLWLEQFNFSTAHL